MTQLCRMHDNGCHCNFAPRLRTRVVICNLSPSAVRTVRHRQQCLQRTRSLMRSSSATFPRCRIVHMWIMTSFSALGVSDTLHPRNRHAVAITCDAENSVNGVWQQVLHKLLRTLSGAEDAFSDPAQCSKLVASCIDRSGSSRTQLS